VNEPEVIETKLRARNKHHFGQAHGLFSTVPTFSEWIDWGASTHQANMILEGTFSDAEIEELAQDLVRHMKKRSGVDNIQGTLTVSEWIGKIKAWAESTSTSPSGFHLTHSKALIAKHDLPLDSVEGKILEMKREKLIEWQVALLNLAIQNSYSFQRWQTIVNVLILKEPGNLKIHRLRVIHLYEHDYNLILAVKWRQLIHSCAFNRKLNEGQYGAVPGRDAIIPTVIEELQYEICRASKRPLIHLDFDATACYDRITMNLASLISRSFGQDKNIAFINATTLKEAKYILKTKLGISEASYKHCLLFPIYGSGQGAGNSPAIWCVISSVLFDLYEEKAHGAHFESPCGKFKVHIYMVGFVDDTSGSVNDFCLEEAQAPEHYVSLAKHDAQRWNDVLKLSAGALEDSKSSYHFLYYDFTLSGLAIMRGGTFEPTICIKLNSGTAETPLKQLSAHTAHKTLGAHKAPASNNTKAFSVLTSINTTHSKCIARAPFDPTDTWAYYHAIYNPSITYPFPSYALSKSQCERLQVQVKKAVLPKCGYNRCTPNAVAYGHSDYAGIELRTMAVEQGMAQLQSFILCLRSDGVPRKLAMIAQSWAQYLAGTSKPIFEDVHTPLPHLDPMLWIPGYVGRYPRNSSDFPTRSSKGKRRVPYGSNSRLIFRV
jgi:hypothetical protein